MRIEVFPDVVLPNRVIAAGVSGSNNRRNERELLLSGHMGVTAGTDQTLREFSLGIAPMLREAWQDIETIYEITYAGVYGFLMEDPKDSKVKIDSGVVARLSATQFQLYQRKTHALSGRYADRRITRPRASTLTVLVSEVPTTYTVDETTGIATIASDPDPADVKWSGRTYLPVHFQSDSIAWEMITGHQDPDARYLEAPAVIVQEVRE
jgi:uncharacterized protein (TIGR02217 family)